MTEFSSPLQTSECLPLNIELFLLYLHDTTILLLSHYLLLHLLTEIVTNPITYGFINNDSGGLNCIRVHIAKGRLIESKELECSGDP